MPRKIRDYDKEYAAYDGNPEVRARRAERMRARRAYEKAHGNLPSTTEIDHIVPLTKGGKSGPKNLRAVPEGQNASFARNKDGSLKSQISKRERSKKK